MVWGVSRQGGGMAHTGAGDRHVAGGGSGLGVGAVGGAGLQGSGMNLPRACCALPCGQRTPGFTGRAMPGWLGRVGARPLFTWPRSPWENSHTQEGLGGLRPRPPSRPSRGRHVGFCSRACFSQAAAERPGTGGEPSAGASQSIGLILIALIFWNLGAQYVSAVVSFY